MLNEIRSKVVLRNILDKIRNRIKLRLFKYNKKLLYKLNLTIKDFEQFNLLNKINKIFYFNIKDLDIEDLNMNSRIKDKKSLEYLTDIEFKELKNLNLENNYLGDIKFLELLKF